MNDLSFDFNDVKQFNLFGINDFTEQGKGEVHYLFSNDPFIFWVNTINDTIIGVSEIHREELDCFELNKEITNAKYEAHVRDAKLLNTPEYIQKLQEIINIKPRRLGFK